MPEETETDFCNLTFRSSILDSIPANIAVIAPSGEILAVNLRWQEFADVNQMSDDANLGIGANYFDVCRDASADPNARTAMKGIREVIRRRRSFFYHEYPCHSPDEQRWFALRATPLIDYPYFVVVSHENITERIAAEIAAGTPEDE